jgi:hypothetical protein
MGIHRIECHRHPRAARLQVERFEGRVLPSRGGLARLIAAAAAPAITIDVNNTATKDDDITTLIPGKVVQTIQAKVTDTGGAGMITLSVSGGGDATLDKTTLNLAAGGSATIVITPTKNSAAANDVKITAKFQGNDVGSQTLTIVNVSVPQHIRAASTPADMKADRIPPRVDTAITVTVTPDLTGTGQVVTLSITGQSADNGTVTINGDPTVNVVKTGPVNLRGTAQTKATAGDGGGNAGKLVLLAQVRGADAAKSDGFSVSAVPQNWKVTFDELITGGGRLGIRVINSWESDSGDLSDLDQVERSEVVEYLAGTGVFKPVKSGENSGYKSATSGEITDSHSTPVALLKGPGGVGKIVANQTFKFKDKRTGVKDIPATNSGFTITRDLFMMNGKLMLTTTKEGADVTAKGIASKAGTGSVSKTQEVP